MHVPMTDPAIATDFWGIVVPAWIGAIGTVAAAIIGVVALFRSNSAVGGVRVLKDGIQTTECDLETGADGQDESFHAVITEDELNAQVKWSLDVGDSGRATLVSESWAEVELLELVPSEGLHLTLRFALPVIVPSGAPISFIIHRVLGGPAVRSVTVRARAKNSETHAQVFYL